MLREHNIDIEDASSCEDKYLKIDGFIINEQNQKIPIQIKYRNNNKKSDDLLMEVA